ncbi:MAG: 23S rRNA (pseudouridine(1915)-N(3))-methyltransferase RlmH [Clostridia bacterium]|nr:23S rRNA (pseudouridine(1915)-N(3))-methyltransferase RlmH [Clostridia bacterium]
MINLKIIAVGNLKDRYLTDACAEYVKRLSGFCRPEVVELKEARLSDAPTDGEIAAALEDEAARIIATIPPRAFTVALAVEGQSMPSEKLAARIESELQSHSTLCFIIGSSYGLSARVKAAADMRLSLSELTFPHRLFRVMLLETIYRSFTIIKGTRYHK